MREKKKTKIKRLLNFPLFLFIVKKSTRSDDVYVFTVVFFSFFLLSLVGVMK